VSGSLGHRDALGQALLSEGQILERLLYGSQRSGIFLAAGADS
jgi:hypothetical protein